MKINNIVRCTCPRCGEAPLFTDPNPYNIRTWDKMHERCQKCSQRFELEPGFYQGAMYVSYALTVAWSVAMYIVFKVWLDLSPFAFFMLIIGTLAALAPLLFRWSRSLYLHFFVPFEGGANSGKA
jgi:uncharacterized protein (DUF983 family)